MTPPRLIAATGCPTGIAHTYMAQESLEQAAGARGISMQVETHGQVGIENSLSAADIAAADGVIVAADKDVRSDRFAGKPLVEVGVQAAIRDADKLIDQVLEKIAHGAAAQSSSAAEQRPVDEGDFLNVAAMTTPSGSSEWKRHLHSVYKHLMNGVSHMLPFVVGGGILIAVSFLWGIYSADPDSSEYNRFAAMLKEIGGIALGLMVPVLAAFIAESIGKRPALTVGFVTGLIAANAGAGFLGGIIAGFLSGYGMNGLAWALRRMPQTLNGLKAIFIYPLVGIFVFGSLIYLLSSPLAGLTSALQDFLSGFQGSSPVALGLLVGAMCGFDLGGPVNKAAYVTGVALLADGNLEFMAGVSAACITPPLVTAFATVLFRRGFEPAERKAGLVNFILGSTHITEGAIPFAARNPVIVLPIFMASSAISAVLTYLWGVEDPAPHGGFLVLPLVSGAMQWVLAILIGSLAGSVAYGLWRSRQLAPTTSSTPQEALA